MSASTPFDFVVALLGLALRWRDGRVRAVCLLVVVGCLAWGAGGMGYSRYGLYLEVLSGVAAVAVAASFMRVTRPDSAAPSWGRAVPAVLGNVGGRPTRAP